MAQKILLRRTSKHRQLMGCEGSTLKMGLKFEKSQVFDLDGCHGFTIGAEDEGGFEVFAV